MIGQSTRRVGWTAVGALTLAAACVAPNPHAALGLPRDAPPDAVAHAAHLSDRALELWIRRTARLQELSQRLRIAGRALCEVPPTPILGLAVYGPGEVPLGLSGIPHVIGAAAERRFGGPSRLVVTEVFADLAAARAGVRPGDVLLAIDGEPLRRGTDVYAPRGAAAETLVLQVERDGVPLELEVAHEPGCPYRAVLLVFEAVNASAGGQLTAFYTALLRELDSDAQLALIVGHEIAHHIIRTSGTTHLSRLEIEARADYIGAYLVARAGFELSSDDESVFLAIIRGDVSRIGRATETHPVTPSRMLALRRTLEEIRDKRALGAPLLPTVGATP